MNYLFILQEKKEELAHLAHKCCSVNKYCVETCCVIGEDLASTVDVIHKIMLHLSAFIFRIKDEITYLDD